jgi:hypothetical protein
VRASAFSRLGYGGAILDDGELLMARRFDTRAPAVQSAVVKRQAIEKGRTI